MGTVVVTRLIPSSQFTQIQRNGWTIKTYRTVRCSHEGLLYELEARAKGEDEEDLPEDAELDCRIMEDNEVVIEGEDLLKLGEDIGEIPGDEPVRYLQEYLRREHGDGIYLIT